MSHREGKKNFLFIVISLLSVALIATGLFGEIWWVDGADVSSRQEYGLWENVWCRLVNETKVCTLSESSGQWPDFVTFAQVTGCLQLSFSIVTCLGVILNILTKNPTVLRIIVISSSLTFASSFILGMVLIGLFREYSNQWGQHKAIQLAIVPQECLSFQPLPLFFIFMSGLISWASGFLVWFHDNQMYKYRVESKTEDL